MITCKREMNSRYIEYLKAEKNMRDRLNNKYVLIDSLMALQEKFGVDPDRELGYLKDHPEQWMEVLKTLRNERSK